MRSLLDRTGTESMIAWLVLSILGVGAFVTSFGYGVLVEEGKIGPGFVPMAAAGLLALQSIALLVRSLRRFRSVPEAETDTDSADIDGASKTLGNDLSENAHAVTDHRRNPDTYLNPESAEPDIDRFGRTAQQRVRMLWLVFGMLIIAVLLVNVIGFLVAFGLLVFAISAGIERRRILTSLLIAVIAAILIYLIFVQFLAVPLPAGLLGLGAMSG